MQRYASIVGIRDDKLQEYETLHAAVWPGVLRTIQQCNIRNYSIFLAPLPDGLLYLFSYFEYHGENFEADLAKMAADPETQRWWSVCGPCQIPLANRKPAEWWMGLREIFHMD